MGIKIRKLLSLSFALAIAEFKLKNEGSYFGILWYLLNPLLTFSLLFLVFAQRLGNSISSYQLYLMIGIVMFNFFQSVSSECTKAIYSHHLIIKSIKFPQEAIIGSVILKILFSHFFEMLLFIVFLVIFGVPVSQIIFYPFILIFLCFFVFGVSLILSSLAVYFIDLANIWGFVSRLIWLATPIFYEIGGQTRLFIFNLFNPMYYFITISRDIIVYSRMPQLWMVAGAAGYTILSVVIGIIIFNKLKIKFAELL